MRQRNAVWIQSGLFFFFSQGGGELEGERGEGEERGKKEKPKEKTQCLHANAHTDQHGVYVVVIHKELG